MDLTSSIQYMKGVGPRRAAWFDRLGIKVIGDLLYHRPRRYLDRGHLRSIRGVQVGETVTLVGRVMSFQVVSTRTRRRDFFLALQDSSGLIGCRWFNQPYLEKRFHVGDLVVVSGKVGLYRRREVENPEFEILDQEDQELIHTGRIVPLYPLTAGLSSRFLRALVKRVLDECADRLPETIPATVLQRTGFAPLREALRNLHFPPTLEDAERGRVRLAFDEFFYFQLLQALRKRAAAVPKEGIVFTRRMHLANRLLESLAFTLTSAQRRVLEEIERDMMSPRAMNRLLQGDVGSGKTVVALVAMLTAAENGYQVAFMAPTEILAEQHYLVIREMVRDLGVRVTLLRGAMRAAQRKEAQTAIATGASGIIIGTHALIEEDVGFHRLGMVVVDEQHRFGVAQRAALRKKGLTPDCLVMTATPIPRTLSMTLYGDLDVSALDEMPRGRKRIITRWVREEGARDRVYEFLRSQVRKGRQVYVVCPLVDETEKGDIRAATEMYERLRALVFPDLRVGLLHGRLRSDEKDGAMQAFRRGDLHLLVATTVIEVGVDVPNATVMLIEHAERFGLAQLHQLRGRVGRGAEQSYCLLLSSGRLSAEARERLSTMEQTQDGFRIAEIDLKLRGPGEFLGTRQHGLPDFKMADLLADVTVLRLARREAFDLIERDPLLLEREHTPVRRNLQHSFAERLDLIKIG